MRFVQMRAEVRERRLAQNFFKKILKEVLSNQGGLEKLLSLGFGVDKDTPLTGEALVEQIMRIAAVL